MSDLLKYITFSSIGGVVLRMIKPDVTPWRVIAWRACSGFAAIPATWAAGSHFQLTIEILCVIAFFSSFFFFMLFEKLELYIPGLIDKKVQEYTGDILDKPSTETPTESKSGDKTNP